MGKDNEPTINKRKSTETLTKEHSMADAHTKGRRQQLYTASRYRKTAKKVKPYRTIKHNNQPRCVSQKELTICNFPSNFRNYSLSQMPSDGKTNYLTISISSSRGLGTCQVLTTRTPRMVLGTYATISL